MSPTNILLPCKSGDMIEGVWLPTSGKLEAMRIERASSSGTLISDARTKATNEFGVPDPIIRLSGDLRYGNGVVYVVLLWVKLPKALKGLRYAPFDEALQDKTFGDIVKAVSSRLRRHAD
jgi:hypothetical protein